MTLQQIASQVRVSKRTIGRIVAGQGRPHHPQTVSRDIKAANAIKTAPEFRAMVGRPVTAATRCWTVRTIIPMDRAT